jgi:hypothetical protein
LEGARQGSKRVNLRHERLVRTGPLNPNLPPLQTHRQAAAMRQEPTLRRAEDWPPAELEFYAKFKRFLENAETPAM